MGPRINSYTTIITAFKDYQLASKLEGDQVNKPNLFSAVSKPKNLCQVIKEEGILHFIAQFLARLSSDKGKKFNCATRIHKMVEITDAAVGIIKQLPPFAQMQCEQIEIADKVSSNELTNAKAIVQGKILYHGYKNEYIIMQRGNQIIGYQSFVNNKGVLYLSPSHEVLKTFNSQHEYDRFMADLTNQAIINNPYFEHHVEELLQNLIRIAKPQEKGNTSYSCNINKVMRDFADEKLLRFFLKHKNDEKVFKQLQFLGFGKQIIQEQINNYLGKIIKGNLAAEVAQSYATACANFKLLFKSEPFRILIAINIFTKKLGEIVERFREQNSASTHKEQVLKDWHRAKDVYVNLKGTQIPIGELVNEDMQINNINPINHDYSDTERKLLPLLLNQDYRSIVMMPLTLALNGNGLILPGINDKYKTIFTVCDPASSKQVIVQAKMEYEFQDTDCMCKAIIEYSLHFERDFIAKVDYDMSGEFGVVVIKIDNLILKNPLAYE